MEVASSIGLNPCLPNDAKGPGPAAVEDEAGHPFRLTAMLDDQEFGNNAALLYNHPMRSAHPYWPADFDAKSVTMLCVRICGVWAPTQGLNHLCWSTSSSSVSIRVSRTNEDDLLSQLFDGDLADAAEKASKLRAVEKNLRGSFGEHFSCDTLNNAYQNLFPREEAWWIQVEVFDHTRFSGPCPKSCSSGATMMLSISSRSLQSERERKSMLLSYLQTIETV